MKQRAEQEGDEPPQPPSVSRGLELNWPQLIGFPMLALIPLLAIAGVFGEHWGSAEANGARLRVHVEYPDRFRATLTQPMTVSIENRSTEALDTVEVVFDSAYVERFTAVNFIPSPRDAFVVAIAGVQPGETRRIHAQLAGGRVGRHAGRIVIRTRDDSAVVVVRTTVFP